MEPFTEEQTAILAEQFDDLLKTGKAIEQMDGFMIQKLENITIEKLTSRITRYHHKYSHSSRLIRWYWKRKYDKAMLVMNEVIELFKEYRNA